MFYYYPTTALGLWLQHISLYYKGPALCRGNCLVIRQWYHHLLGILCVQSHCGQLREYQRKHTLPLRVTKLSPLARDSWPSEASNYVLGGDDYADECQLHSRGAELRALK